jgi:Na+/proline symporter
MLRLHPGTVDYIIIAIYFAVVLGIGFIARLRADSPRAGYVSSLSGAR